MPQYFAIVGEHDKPLYEAEFTQTAGFAQEIKELNPFILHAALDIVEDLQWQPSAGTSGASVGNGFLRSRSNVSTDNCYLGQVDHFYGLAITAYLTYGGKKFVMLHGNNSTRGKNSHMIDDNMVRSFYQDVHELYIKTLMNPFYTQDSPIESPTFDLRVQTLAKKYLK
ncbi:Trafficking protein particle complex subunit 20 [Nakaseomyces bracarensis]|uniref:Trafficking protein particle complex subunit 20 n=1 Tax=Nakaseomyces bracarensis TaxID=273131 RepID=A0ABR4P110_9SACH